MSGKSNPNVNGSEELVSVIITFLKRDLQYLKPLIESIRNQSYQNLEIIIVDQSRTDRIENHLRKVGILERSHIIKHDSQKGFSENYNSGIDGSKGEYIFILNPDTKLDPDCVHYLVQGIYKYKQVGCVAPKILRMHDDPTSVIDSAGMILTRNIRHFDRGAGKIDQGQYDSECFVFGATGAGAFYSRKCLEETTILGQYYDEDFWSYREDADLSWRIQNRGWNCLYFPKSIMYHHRRSKPGKRSSNPSLVNMHSVKNRYLLILNNLSLRSFLVNLPFIMLREITIFFGVILLERSSIPAYSYLLRNLQRLIRKRRVINQVNLRDASLFWVMHKYAEIR